MAGLLAIGAAACGDDVQVVEPTPPVPPPPPPLSASMAPASAEVEVGSSVVFAVNASGGVVGEAASWSCASSNTGIATVTQTSAGCQATGVAAGGVTITATVSKGSETANVGAQLTVTAPAAPPPFEASIAPESQSVAVGSSVVFAVNTSGGYTAMMGDMMMAASWTCSSSDPAIATVETTEAGCQATGVSGGDVTINVAATDGHATVNLVAQLTVTSDPVETFSATMSPESATVAVGSDAVFAINTSGGAAGATASWTCSSSDDAIATAETTDAGCQATGVAPGGVTINAAVTKGGASRNLASQLTVTAPDVAEPAFVLIAKVTDKADDGGALKGTVSATVNVERGDQNLQNLALLVDGNVVVSQSFGVAAAAPADEPAEQAVHAFTLSFNSAEYDEGTGAVTYTNGNHTIAAQLTVAGSADPVPSNTLTVEFDNDNAVNVSVSGTGAGALNTSTGQHWYGGPEFAMQVAAVPVLYEGAGGAVTLRAFCGGEAINDAEAPYTFSPKCGKDYVTTAANGDSLTFNIGGKVVSNVVGADKMFLDFDGPGAPTFKPNPNKREDGWINAAVGITSTSSAKDSWLTKVGEDDNGVGGYAARLHYVAKPKTGSHAKAAVAAAASTSLPTEHKTKDRYCVFASAVDRLDNSSDLPKADAATCNIAGVKATTGDSPTPATGYEKLLADAAATAATAATKALLTNAGILAGVDLTAPTVEFLASALNADTTHIAADNNGGWGVHVSDQLGTAHSDPLSVSVKVRESNTKTTTLKRAKATTSEAHPDSFRVVPVTGDDAGAGFRHHVRITGSEASGDAAAKKGYYLFSATAKDKAGNESAARTRVALHDPTAPPTPGLFLTPADGGGYESVIVLTEDLSIRSYSTAVVLPTIGDVTTPEVVLTTGTVDEYNAASMKTSATYRPPVNLPYKALQDDTDSEITADDAVDDFKVYVTNQAKTSASASVSVSVSTSGISALAFRTGSEGLMVTTHGATGSAPVNTFPATGSNSKSMRVKVVADMTDNAASTNAPFSAVGLYAQVRVGPSDARVNQLRQIGTITSGKTALTGTGRTWTYEATLPLDAVWALVKDDENITSDNPNYAGRIVAFGVDARGRGLVVAENHAENVTINKR